MSICNFLLKIGFLDLTVGRMHSFVDESNRPMILWAFANGRYDVRKLGVEYFIENSESDSIPILQKAINDKVEMISQTAMTGLERLTTSPEIHKKLLRNVSFGGMKMNTLKSEGIANIEKLPF